LYHIPCSQVKEYHARSIAYRAFCPDPWRKMRLDLTASGFFATMQHGSRLGECQMAKVWQRKWMTATGEQRSAWVADYFSSQGERHIKTFAVKKDATRYLEQVMPDVRRGIHTAPSKSVTVAEAAESWLKRVEAEGRE